MMKPIDIPVVPLGPGSQPQDEDRLIYMEMPKAETYTPPTLPEPEDVAGLSAGREVLERLSVCLQRYDFDDDSVSLVLDGLDGANQALVNQTLGEGEVSARVTGDQEVRIQETVFAGVWRVLAMPGSTVPASDCLEIGSYPKVLREAAETGTSGALCIPRDVPSGCMNAPGVLVEVNEALAVYQPGGSTHVINLSLLPLSPDDTDFIDRTLGVSPVMILSRGYGNCRVTATGTRHLWRVQFYNSQDVLILDTLEITTMPDVVVAAREDLEDSSQRLDEVLQWFKGH